MTSSCSIAQLAEVTINHPSRCISLLLRCYELPDVDSRCSAGKPESEQHPSAGPGGLQKSNSSACASVDWLSDLCAQLQVAQHCAFPPPGTACYPAVQLCTGGSSLTFSRFLPIDALSGIVRVGTDGVKLTLACESAGIRSGARHLFLCNTSRPAESPGKKICERKFSLEIGRKSPISGITRESIGRALLDVEVVDDGWRGLHRRVRRRRRVTSWRPAGMP